MQPPRIAVLQARTSSSRLPAKVMLPVGDMPLVVLAARRAANTGLHVIVATSDEASDDALAETVRAAGIPVHRGSLEDTLSRVVNACADQPDGSLVFRLTGDNVFPDGDFLDRLGEHLLSHDLRYVTSTGKGSQLPYGLSAEVMRLSDLRHAAREAVTCHDREHVTPYLIRQHGATFCDAGLSAPRAGLRCTVDGLDDYLTIREVFSGITDPVHAPLSLLMDRLACARFQPTLPAPASRLVLGTAQLGGHYGIANRDGQPTQIMAETLVKTAIIHGVAGLDTASAYGQSETVLGRILQQGWAERTTVLTKLSPLTDCPLDAAPPVLRAFAEQSLFRSCRLLGRKTLDVLMLHRARHLDDWDGALMSLLREWRDAGIIRAIGVSVQTPAELSRALDWQDVTLVQLPFNLLDWRWHDLIPRIRSEKARRELLVHARSTLLQGLLVSADATLWQRAHAPTDSDLPGWLARQAQALARNDVTDLAVAYVNAQDWIDALVIGMETPEQLAINLRLLARPALEPEAAARLERERPHVSEGTLDPSQWNR